MIVSEAKRDRNRAVRSKRRRGLSQREIARAVGLSRRRVRQLLEEAGGDPYRDAMIARMSFAELERDRDRLVDRIRSDLRRLAGVNEELESRRVDRINGLAS